MEQSDHPAIPLLRDVLSPFAEELHHPDFEDLLIQKPGEAWVRIGGVMRRRDMPLDFTDLQGLIFLVASLKAQNVGRHKPLLSADLPGGVRVQGVLPPCVNDGTVAIAIRRPKGRAPTMAEIVAGGMFSDVGQHRDRGAKRRLTGEIRRLLVLYHAARAAKGPEERGERWAGFFRETIAARLTHVLCGEVATGKTHFAMGLADFIDHDLRLATIQDADEWNALPHPNRVDLFHSKGEQGAAVGATDIVEACLRLSMHWLLVQEVRGADAFALMRGRRSGHASITTCHADSPEGVFPALALMAKMHLAASGIDLRTLENAWRGLIDVAVHFHRPGGKFRVSDVWFRPAEMSADAQEAAEAAVEELTEALEPDT